MRSIAEYTLVPVWNSSLTSIQVNQIEIIQKKVFQVILGSNYTSYSKALKLLGMQKISDRRRHLCLNFTRKCEKRPQFSKRFIPNKKRIETTRCPKIKFTSFIQFCKEYKEQKITSIFMSMDVWQHFWDILTNFLTKFSFFFMTSYSGQFFCSLGKRG